MTVEIIKNQVEEPDKIVYCKFYEICNYAKPEGVCRTGGGKYCGTWRTLSYMKKAKEITEYFK